MMFFIRRCEALRIELKALRVNAHLNQREAAERAGVTRETIQNWENYRTFPNASQLIKLAGIYKCTIDDIFIPDKLAKSE